MIAGRVPQGKRLGGRIESTPRNGNPSFVRWKAQGAYGNRVRTWWRGSAKRVGIVRLGCALEGRSSLSVGIAGDCRRLARGDRDRKAGGDRSAAARDPHRPEDVGAYDQVDLPQIGDLVGSDVGPGLIGVDRSVARNGPSWTKSADPRSVGGNRNEVSQGKRRKECSAPDPQAPPRHGYG